MQLSGRPWCQPLHCDMIMHVMHVSKYLPTLGGTVTCMQVGDGQFMYSDTAHSKFYANNVSLITDSTPCENRSFDIHVCNDTVTIK